MDEAGRRVSVEVGYLIPEHFVVAYGAVFASWDT
jgi:hypothetical protein